jgi:hypothetical protein
MAPRLESVDLAGECAGGSALTGSPQDPLTDAFLDVRRRMELLESVGGIGGGAQEGFEFAGYRWVKGEALLNASLA